MAISEVENMGGTFIVHCDGRRCSSYRCIAEANTEQEAEEKLKESRTWLVKDSGETTCWMRFPLVCAV